MSTKKENINSFKNNISKFHKNYNEIQKLRNSISEFIKETCLKDERIAKCKRIGNFFNAPICDIPYVTINNRREYIINVRQHYDNICLDLSSGICCSLNDISDKEAIDFLNAFVKKIESSVTPEDANAADVLENILKDSKVYDIILQDEPFDVTFCYKIALALCKFDKMYPQYEITNIESSTNHLYLEADKSLEAVCKLFLSPTIEMLSIKTSYRTLTLLEIPSETINRIIKRIIRKVVETGLI